MRIDNRLWLLLAVMILGAVYIGWLHVTISDLTIETTTRATSKEALWPPVDARSDGKKPLTIIERND